MAGRARFSLEARPCRTSAAPRDSAITTTVMPIPCATRTPSDPARPRLAELAPTTARKTGRAHPILARRDESPGDQTCPRHEIGESTRTVRERDPDGREDRQEPCADAGTNEQTLQQAIARSRQCLFVGSHIERQERGKQREPARIDRG